MFASQNGLCASCGNPETKIDHRSGTIKELAVDHDHATGKIRALLCNSCNVALGLLQDDPAFFEAACTYIPTIPLTPAGMPYCPACESVL
jgi:hypothetical protein